MGIPNPKTRMVTQPITLMTLSGCSSQYWIRMVVASLFQEEKVVREPRPGAFSHSKKHLRVIN